MNYFLKKSDYARENKRTHKSVGYKQNSRGVKLPTQMRSAHADKQFLKQCPTGCTQHRNQKMRLLSKNTFDIRTNECRNCGFKKLPKDAKLHGAGFKKASEL